MHPSEAKLMQLMKTRKTAKASELSGPLGIGKDIVGRLAYSLSKKGFIKIEKTKIRSLKLTPEGKDVLKKGVIEARILDKLPIEPNKLKGTDVIALNWAIKRKWAEMKDGVATRVVENPPTTNEEIYLKDYNNLDVADPKVKLLKKRKWISFKEDFDYDIEITEKGLEQNIKEEVTQVTQKMLVNGDYKNKKFMAFSPNTEVPPVYAGRIHPLNDIIQKVRRVFLEMGFTEVEGPHQEFAFWDFDALFVPQDHPAREMQDTFYIEGEESELPRISRDVQKTHEKFWGSWNEQKAKKKLLRTHTTAVSARMLSQVEKPAKLFTIGKVFRNETVDYKHLAEFYQVEGIVMNDDVTFNNLVGYLKDFFRKLGFDKVRIRPGYFPYTEMSAEVDVWLEDKRVWMELGGAGIFRPEVVKPLTGRNTPVLAWGLGIGRIAMMTYGLNDVRELYQSDLKWLRDREVFK